MISSETSLIHLVLFIYLVCTASVLLYANYALPLFTYYLFWILAGFNLFIGVYVICEAVVAFFVRIAKPPAEMVEIVKDELFRAHRLTIIIAAYLPNEQELIMQTLDHYKTVVYPVPYQIILAYNTPNPLPIEKDLAARASNDPRLKCVCVPDSTSKAENVNYVLSLMTDVSPAHIISIYDADHHPSKSTFIRVINSFTKHKKLDAIQGRCIIRNSCDTFITRMVDVEFDMIYNIFHVGFNFIHRHGLFGGTNGHWRSTLLAHLRMDHNMLTEDIDLTIRSLIQNNLIAYDHRIESYELAPTTLQAYIKQRSRWAQGWFQVTLSHSYSVFNNPSSAWRRIGLTLLLPLREISFHLQTWLTILTIEGLIISPPSYNNLIWAVLVSNLILGIMLLTACRSKSASILFLICFMGYMILQTYIVLIGELKEFLIIKKWKVTAREGKLVRRVESRHSLGSLHSEEGTSDGGDIDTIREEESVDGSLCSTAL